MVQFPKVEPSADSLGEVEADDSFLYYIKGDVAGKATRASEWLGTQIAEAVGLAAPAPCVIELQDGSTVFGSRRIAGVADAAVTMAFLTAPTASNQSSPVAGLSALLSKIYALDMFCYNDDRHLGNYLSVDDRGRRRLYAFDFSRAFFWTWPWNGGYPSPQSNTRRWGSFLRRFHGFDEVAAGSTLDAIGNIAPAAISGFINQMPSDWMGATLKAEFSAVWEGTACASRVDALRKGFQDGTLL
ncbi:HipA family kinase [Bradyrhizobium sp. 930_D9_N1_4]|uniref:HipA family kinase n=1 Tax=Bradyrhizobium sp. 930_D9_N1_4 TaxID=3240374 RepID=UPI003F8BAE09